MAFVAILTSVISASYYLRIVVLLISPIGKSISLENTENNNKFITSKLKEKINFNNEFILTNYHSFLISTITLSILLFIFKPTLLLNSTQLLSLSLFNY